METSAAKQSPLEAPADALSDEPKSEAVALSQPPDAAPADDIWRDLLSATQGWIQYGTLGFAILCIIVGAVEALFGR